MLKSLAKVADDDEELELSQDLLDHAQYVPFFTSTIKHILYAFFLQNLYLVYQ